MGYTGWALNEVEMSALRRHMHIPKFPDVRGHHVTHTFGVGPEHPLPAELSGTICGYASDDKGVEALILRIGGTTKRPDGSVFHVTWSLDKSAGYSSADSNKIIAERGWSPFKSCLLVITLEPRYWPS
jgi:hypothetical protein